MDFNREVINYKKSSNSSIYSIIIKKNFIKKSGEKFNTPKIKEINM
jgi:hypothetical protein